MAHVVHLKELAMQTARRWFRRTRSFHQRRRVDGSSLALGFTDDFDHAVQIASESLGATA